MESVRTWMTRMDCTPRSEELRILLLEREGKTISDSSWLGPDFRDTDLDQWCHSDSFLRLDPMTDEQIMAVMTDYAAAAGKTLNAALLLKTLERVDPQLKRPLYALAIADARCQGKDPTNWDRDKILDTLLDRELKFHLDRLQGIFDRKIKISKTVEGQLELLLAESCVQFLLPLESLDWTQYGALHKLMNDANMEPEEFCQRLGIMETAELCGPEVVQDEKPIVGSVLELKIKVIAINCPDLLKEHLVLKMAFEQNKYKLLPDGWHLDLARLFFLRRLWINYPHRLKDETAFWDRFFTAPPIDGPPAWFYGELLWDCTNISPHHAKRAVDILAKLYKLNKEDEQIAECYANGLSNLSHGQALADCSRTVEQLKVLYEKYPQHQNIAVRYANSLVNLSCVQPLGDCIATVDRLAELFDTYTDNREIVVPYAKGLINLSIRQASKDCIHTIEQIKDLSNSHPDWHEVAECYASALTNLAFNQTTVSAVQKTLAIAKDLLDKHARDPDIQLCCAKTWFNLTLVQSEADIPPTVSDIAAFLKAHPSAIPGFRKALDEYLAEHPDHGDRYHPLMELGGDSHA